MTLRLTAVLMIVVFGMIGCGPTALQMQGEVAYYQAIAAVTKSQSKESNPLVRIKVADPTKPINVELIEVFAPPPPQYGPLVSQYQQKDYSEPAWRFLGTLASIGLPWLGAYSIIHDIKGMAGNNYNYTNQVAEGATGSFRVQGNTAVTSSGAGAATATGMMDNTSTPTVVHADVVPTEVVVVPQPEPIVVK